MSAKTRKIREQKEMRNVYINILVTMLSRFPTTEEIDSVAKLVESGLIILMKDENRNDGIWFAINTDHPMYNEFMKYEKDINKTVNQIIKNMKENNYENQGKRINN